MARNRLTYLSERPDVVNHGKLSGEYWYRPGELLIHRDDIDRISDEFRGYEIEELTEDVATELAERAAEATGVAPRPAGQAFEAAEQRGLSRFRTSPRMDVPALVEHFRERPGTTPEAPGVRVAPHYVLMAVQAYQAGAVDPPQACGAQDWDARGGNGGRGATVAVLDTGVAPHDELDGRVVAGPDDAELVDEDGDGLRDDQAGHGTFVAGRVVARAGGVTVHARRVLDSWGVTDELTVARALDTLGEVDVVNLSLGCYTHDNTEPMVLSAALSALPAGTVVVAAAGNYAKSRPFWPAALKRCVGVAALAPDGAAAPYTNHGPWVDACAPGTAVASTFLAHTDAPADGEGGASFAGWARWSGTSFAAPYVAAAIAERVRGAVDAREAAYRLLREGRPHPGSGLGVVVT